MSTTTSSRMKAIYIGDPHVQPSNLEDSSKVLRKALDLQEKEKADMLIIGGDLFHTHAVLRLEVVDFWIKWGSILKQPFKDVYAIVGNHDMPGDKQREGVLSALSVLHSCGIKVVDKPTANLSYGVGFLPYISDNEKFYESANHLRTLLPRESVLFCHQTFDGATYDNGFYAPGGLDLNRVDFKSVVSGHIHKAQKFGKVIYPGTPKWDSLSDANEDKGIWVFETMDGEILNGNFHTTSDVIEPIRSHTITPETEGNLDSILYGSRTILELVGPSSWIGKISKKLKAKCRVVARPTDTRAEKKTGTGNAMSIFDYLKTKDDLASDWFLKKYLEELCSE